MSTVRTDRYVGALGCAELERTRLLDARGCCAICHSAEGHAPFALGPCRVALPDGREAFVCCSGKKRLLRGATREPASANGRSGDGRT